MCNRESGDDWGAAWASWGGAGWGPPPGFKRGRGEGRRHRGGGRGRIFDRGDLKYVILKLLLRKPMHGYEVMQALEERSRGWYAASAGSVYPVLQLLQDQGYVTSEELEGRRVYTITDAGREFLEKHSERVDDVMDRVSEFAGRFAGGEMESVARSFMALARESFEQAKRVADDPAAAARLRDILDRAAEEMRKPGEAQG